MSGDVVHRLWAVLCATASVLWLAGSVSARRRHRRVRRRLDAVTGPAGAARAPLAGRAQRGQGDGTGPGGTGGEAGPGAEAGRAAPKAVAPGVAWRRAGRRWLPVIGAFSTAYALVGGATGIVLGLLGGGVVWRWRQPVPRPEFDVQRAERELPLAADLLAACIAAGADPVTAARVVGDSLAGPLGERLAWGAAETRLGGDPAQAWRRLSAIGGARPLARLLARTGDSGAPAAASVARLAAEARSARGRAATARARRAGVLITAPVGLCFLPAFIAVGVLPVVIGLAGGLLNGGGG